MPSKRTVHVFDLSEDWTESRKLEVPTGFVQVLRCDLDATLQVKGEAYGFPATTGTVFENTRGVELFKTPDPGGQAIITDGGGVLILAVYENPSDILDVTAVARAFGTRMLDDAQAVAGAVSLSRNAPDARTLYYITGYNAAYSAAPTPVSPGDGVVIFDLLGSAVPSIMYARMTPRGVAGGGQLSYETWFPYPLFCRPGAQLNFTFPSGGAGITGRASIYGGTLRF